MSKSCKTYRNGQLMEHYRATHIVADHPRSGRSRKTDRRTDQWILTKVLHNCRIDSLHIQQECRRCNIFVASCLIRSRLNGVGLHSQRPFKGIILTVVHRQMKPLEVGQASGEEGSSSWMHVLISDESRFSPLGQDGRK